MTAPGRTDAIAAAAAAIRARIGLKAPRFGVVLGSGLGGLTERVRDAIHIPYGDIPGFPLPTVEGHGGELVVGEFGGRDVLMQSGRFHMYEGHSATVAALPVRVFAELGVRTLILTNAAGAIRRTYRAGTLMLISDHLNLTGVNPLTGALLPRDERFPDMSEAYDPDLRRLARDVARERGIAVEEGVYAGLPGPSYETGAEVRMLERLGADAVGMSTVVEVIAARARGIRCLGISTITNAAAGTTAAKLSHAEVMEVADRVKGELGAVVAEVVKRA
jgi:purine-nucleoside phosphorylase